MEELLAMANNFIVESSEQKLNTMSIGVAVTRITGGTARWASTLGPIKLGLLLGLIALAGASSEARAVMLQSLSDAFLQVTVFVALTLAVFYILQAVFRIDAEALLARYALWQVPIAAFLGMLPGCGGAVMVITQYIRGGISFGAVVAVLTATMGDAAFLLLAQAPLTGLGIFATGFVVGIISGYIVDMIHGTDFLRYRHDESRQTRSLAARRVDSILWRRLWWAFLLPGLFFGILIAFQVDTEAILGTGAGIDIAVWCGVIGAIISLLLWGMISTDPTQTKKPIDESSSKRERVSDAFARVAGDTCFVTVWVIFAYLLYELGVLFSGVDLQVVFSVWGPLVPLIAILVGFIPGCGPQVIVAAMYLNGTVPLSAELGNAISNDGDALFPAIAMAPKAAVIATLYSGVPALIVAYSYYWLFE